MPCRRRWQPRNSHKPIMIFAQVSMLIFGSPFWTASLGCFWGDRVFAGFAFEDPADDLPHGRNPERPPSGPSGDDPNCRRHRDEIQPVRGTLCDVVEDSDEHGQDVLLNALHDDAPITELFFAR